MGQLASSSRDRLGSRPRAGFSTRGLILALLVVLAVPAIAWSVLSNGTWTSRDEDGPMMHRVERGPFIHDVSERGSVESASNVEIVSKVKSARSGSSSSGGSTFILWVIPEGTHVKPGDKVCELDSSALKDQTLQQQIVVHNSRAAVIQAENIFRAAEIAKLEYVNGTYEEEKLTLENQIEESTEKRDRLKQYWDFSKMMHEKGYVTKLQLQADLSALLQAQNALDLAVLKSKVLEDYQKEKMVLQLDADIVIAKAKQDAMEASHALEEQQLKDIEEQFANCTIYTEEAGQVVYANREGHRGEGAVVIEEGTPIRERQVIIRLPDPKRMQVKARVNEARVKLVRKGMTATIRLDAFPDTELQGAVEEVKEYPAPSWFSNIKEYETFIKILDPSIDLRPGYTAEVKIRVEQLTDVLQVPVQAIIEHGEKHYCVVRDGKRFKAREVVIGSTNDKFVIIESGLEEGAEVVRNAAVYRREVGLPEIPPETVSQLAVRQREEQAPGETQGTEPQQGRPDVGRMMQGIDKNGDGQLDKDEVNGLPEQLRSRLTSADKNGDGIIDRGELTAAIAQAGQSAVGTLGDRPGGPQAGDRPGGPRAGGRPRGRNSGTTP